MIIWITTAIAAVLAIAGMGLYYTWKNSGWLTDRRHAISKLDTLLEELGNFNERFPEVGARLHLSDVREVWPQQRAQVIQECTFAAWLLAGRPRETSFDSSSAALFRFARSQAGPLVWSMTQVLQEPDTVLISRIRAAISSDTHELRFSPPKARRPVPERRLSDI